MMARYSKQFPKEVAEYIRANCEGITCRSMAKRLSEKFGKQYTESQIQSYYANHSIKNGLREHYQEGAYKRYSPPKGVCPKALEPWKRQTGSQGNPRHPVGATVKRAGGYVYRKIGKSQWKKEHHIVWEAANGPIPSGKMLVFKDGDCTNCDLENLALISRAENIILTRKKLRFNDPTLTECGIALARLQSAINDTEETNENHQAKR